MTNAGAFLIGLATITLITLGAWISGNGRRSEEDTLLFFAGLGLRQQELVTALLASALSFAILGLALNALPG